MTAPACKVSDLTEVTPEMVEAGAKALDEYLFERDPEAQPLGPYSLKIMARRIFEAMTGAKEIQ